jgi:lipid-binding SYLF domain-containing protein
MADTAAEINAEADKALTKLYTEVKGAESVVSKSEGVLIFPSVRKAGLGIGGETGEGVLRIDGKPVAFYNTKSLSIGLQAGVQSKSVVLVFKTKEAVEKFQKSSGWEAGVDGSVAVIKTGADGSFDTASIKEPVSAFVFGQSGLMADLSLKGSKFSKSEKTL